ncbi:MAG: carboxylating nicotinate-nucleotide diphosphorylase [Cyanobacteria bacterium]|nr:carboxylating nicotinate-nucleotide diphosphorylase [Cyanobacteriota bacterium]
MISNPHCFPPGYLNRCVQIAVEEDLIAGDITTDNLPFSDTPISARLMSRSAGVLSGLTIAEAVFHSIDPNVSFHPVLFDGAALCQGAVIAEIVAPASTLLKGERVALNFLQHLSGIASTTAQWTQAVSGLNVRITDTRKTLPGLRLLEKHAVIHGGGHSHRLHLGTSAMLKDNHLFALSQLASPMDITGAVQRLRERLSHTATITVEVDDISQIPAVLASGANAVLLDNFSVEQTKEAVSLIRQSGKAIFIESSGGIRLENVRDYARTGVDIISTSQITMGAQALDLGMDFIDAD